LHRYSWAFNLIGSAVGLILLFGTVLVTAQYLNQTNQTQSTSPLLPTIIRTPSPTRPSYCVPIPRAVQPIGSPTPTPNLFPLASVMPKTLPMPELAPSVTPRVYTNIFDLSPEIPLRDKWETVVFRCHGTFDKFLGGPGIDVDQFLNLMPGDVIINSIPPASLMGHKPPTPPGWPNITPATSMPYPPPITPPGVTPTPFSYPAPATLAP